MKSRERPADNPTAPPQTGTAAELRPRARLAEWRWIPRASRIFVNRNLRLESIAAVGFDLDHTLAHYDPHPVERLAFEATVRKLVEAGHFPRRIRSLRYRPGAMIRGLVVDRRRGNILKVRGLDAIDGTPVIDIKPYIPGYDSVRKASAPPWVIKR